MTGTATPTTTTRDASDIYDRQIRLWGADSQSKISSAKVLYINLTGVSCEILKNLVLAGVQPAICDGRPYPEAMASTPCSFLNRATETTTTVDEEDVDDDKEKGENNGSSNKKRRIVTTTVARALQPPIHELNPLLEECGVDERPLDSIPDEDFTQYDIIIASHISAKHAIRISNACTKAGNAFYLVDTFGFHGCAIVDLGLDHTFRKEIGKDKLSDPIKASLYAPLEQILTLKLGETKKGRWDKTPPEIWGMYRLFLDFQEKNGKWPTAQDKQEFGSHALKWRDEMQTSTQSGGFTIPDSFLGDLTSLESLASIATAEISPVCAVLGGVIGNEVIKALSGKGEPANNVLLFDGNDGGCRSFVAQGL